jgi:hypothetical protein
MPYWARADFLKYDSEVIQAVIEACRKNTKEIPIIISSIAEMTPIQCSLRNILNFLQFIVSPQD